MLAAKSSIVREWRVVTAGLLLRGRGGARTRSSLKGGVWNDNSTAALSLLATLRELGEKEIALDLNWVRRILFEGLGGSSGSWKMKTLEDCILRNAMSEYEKGSVCRGCARHVSPY